MRFVLALLLLLIVAIRVHPFVPEIGWASNARIMIVPMLFFAYAIVLPFPVMLVFAFATGFLWDARFGLATGQEQFDLAFGYSVLLYGLLGTFMQGIRPMFRRGRWELPILMTGFATFSLLVLEYLYINFRRGGFHFPQEIWSRIFTSALFSILIAPFIFIALHFIARRANYRIRYEGLYEISDFES